MSTVPFGLNVSLESINSFESHYSYSPQNLQIDLNQVPEEDDSLHEDDRGSNDMPRLPNKKKNLSSNTKRAIFEMLLIEQKDGVLPKGTVSKVANSFSISTRSVSRIWHEGKSIRSTNCELSMFSFKLLNRACRKRVEIDPEQIKSIPLCRRTNIRSLSKALCMAKSTVHRRVKEGFIRPHTNAIKPHLTDENKKARLEFCLSMVNEGTILTRPAIFDMYNQIHIDEKWFYISKTTENFYLACDETDPLRTCKSKRFITKIMFLAAVARPRFDSFTNEHFNGKIGIWPFVANDPAKWSSRNRAAGTMEPKPVLSVTKKVILSWVEKVLPAIKEKLPRSSSRSIFIQQDNARPHLDVNDAEFVEAAQSDGFDIRLYCQPPNSLDMNVLDLGFFRAIDALQHEEGPSTIEEFVAAVEKAFNEYPPQELNNVFFQGCMVEVMKHLGSYIYKIPHMNKHKLIKDGQLPKCLEFESEVLDIAKTTLSSI
ncbi:hypothetical protein OROMI_012668 [Orobanche minor]